MTDLPCFAIAFREDPARHALVCTLTGKLIGRPDCYSFLQDTRRHIEGGLINVILDFSEIQRIDSTGVGILASIYTSANRRGGRVFIVNPDARAREVMTVMRLFDFLETTATVDAALARAERGD
jgi:anti-anti-sigma factor